MKILRSFLLHSLLFLTSILFLIPLFWMISTSLKTPEQIFVSDIKWIPSPIAWHNYVIIFQYFNLFLYFKNTVFLCILNVCGVLISCSLAAYAFSVLNWKYKNVVFYITLGTMMLPEMVTLVPQFILFQKLGW